MHGVAPRKVLTVSAVLALLVGAASTAPAIAAPSSTTTTTATTTKVVYSFTGGGDGEYPSTDLVVDRAGNLYGTSVEGGKFGTGTVFRLKPTATGWTHSVLYSFTGGADGGQPYGGVTLDAQGNLYGTGVVGGMFTGGPCVESGCGVAFKLSRSGGTWTESVIHTFTGGSDGYGPGGGLTLDKNGNLYGMTPTGGAHSLGIIFQLQPRPSGNWKLKVVHAFSGGHDGATGSAGRLMLDGAGNLFGVATTGGKYGSGTAYSVSPDPAGGWKLTTLYAFKGQPDAGFPYGGLIADASGNLYGTTYYDGANNLGTVYRLARNPAGGWTEQVLHSFTGGTDGSNSISTLVADAAGRLYGTTSEGGSAGCGCGTIFRMARSAAGLWTESVVYRFKGTPDGAFAYNGMAGDSAGNFYGTTVHGGAGNDGAIYQFTP
jgi:uncharacterized repeat protein (TIGR03803 family)